MTSKEEEMMLFNGFIDGVVWVFKGVIDVATSYEMGMTLGNMLAGGILIIIIILGSSHILLSINHRLKRRKQ